MKSHISYAFFPLNMSNMCFFALLTRLAFPNFESWVEQPIRIVLLHAWRQNTHRHTFDMEAKICEKCMNNSEIRRQRQTHFCRDMRNDDQIFQMIIALMTWSQNVYIASDCRSLSVLLPSMTNMACTLARPDCHSSLYSQ